MTVSCAASGTFHCSLSNVHDANGMCEKCCLLGFGLHVYASAGVGRSDVGFARMWYRRNFTIPADWKVAAITPGSSAERVLLHFGAVDWEAEVFVNGQRMGMHRGG